MGVYLNVLDSNYNSDISNTKVVLVMRTYLYCSVCGFLTPLRYDFDDLCWRCAVCGTEQAKPEDELWEKEVGGVKRL